MNFQVWFSVGTILAIGFLQYLETDGQFPTPPEPY